MISFTCPACGSEGKAPPERLGFRVSCPVCEAALRMDMHGICTLVPSKDKLSDLAKKRAAEGAEAASGAATATAVQTETTKAKATKSKKQKPAVAMPKVELDLSGDVEEMKAKLRSLPMTVWYAVGGLAGALVLTLGVMQVARAVGVPADAEGRARYVAEAFVDNRLDRIQSLSTAEGTEPLQKWFDLMRPKLTFQGPRRSSTPLGITSFTMKSDGTRALVLTMITIADGSAAAAVPTAAEAEADAKLPDIVEGHVLIKPSNNLGIETAWKQVGGRWVLDGEGTFGAAKRPVRRDTSKEAKKKRGGAS